MSVYTQEVLGLLKRNKKKKKLDKIRDHFEFGKLFRNSSLNNAPGYQPTMEPFVIKWGDFLCEAQEGLVRQDPTGAEERFITMWTDPIFQGDCSTATITKSIISQNASATEINIAGDLDVDNNLNVDGNAVVDLQLTAGSANILDLTDNRIVIVGPNGELEDDANFTMDGDLFNANVSVTHGIDVPGVPTTNTTINSNLYLMGPVFDSAGNLGNTAQVLIALGDGRVEWKDDDVVEYLTYGSLWQGNQQNLKQELAIGLADQILISDGTTFSWEDNPAAIVGETCAVYTIPLWTPDSNTLGCSKLTQDGDNSTPAQNIFTDVVFNINNAAESKLNLGTTTSSSRHFINFIGPVDYISGITAELDGATDIILSELYTSQAANVLDPYLSFSYDTNVTTNKLVLGGDSAGTKHPGLDLGFVQVLPQLELETVPQDDTLDQVLVRDTATGIVHQRDASTIKPQVGFDTLDMLPNGWASPDENFNAYVKLDDTTTAFKDIKDMTWLVDGDRVLVIAENVKTGSLLADNVLRFPTWGSGSQVFNQTSWNQASIGAGWTGAINNGYETSTLLYGEKIKIKGEMYDTPSISDRQMNWDACCKIYSNNTCPIVNNASFTVDEDAVHNGTLITSDDGYGGYGYTFSIVTNPSNGTISNFDSATGAFTYTPDPNYNGFDSFTYQSNDGYCDSNIGNVNITINSINDSPLWTSVDPTDATYSGTPWTNLTGGDVLTPYNWTVDDPDHTCAELTYNMTLVDEGGNAGTWLTFTPNNPADCGGTLSGTYPVTGGIWTVVLTVTDPVGASAVQEFTISGIVPDKDTYFTVWIDNSGSMSTLAGQVARQVSVGQAIAEVVAVSGSTISVEAGAAAITDSVFINDIDALVAGTQNVGRSTNLLVPDALPTGVTSSFSIQLINTANGNLTNTGIEVLTSGAGTSNILTCDTTIGGAISPGDFILLTITDELASSDYNSVDSLRSLFQDFYAVGGTESSGNTDPATNGRNRYTSHVKFGFMNENPGNGENWFFGLSNYGYQETQAEFNTSISTGGIFDGATTICTLVFGDEASGSYDLGGGPYSGTTTQGGGFLLADLNSTRDWITYGPAATMNGTLTSVNAVGCMFAAATGQAPTNIGMSAGARDGVGFGVTGTADVFGGNWSNTAGSATQLPIEPSPPTPRKIEFSGYDGDPTFGTGGIPQSTPAGQPGFYQNLIRTKLQDLGFQNI